MKWPSGRSGGVSLMKKMKVNLRIKIIYTCIIAVFVSVFLIMQYSFNRSRGSNGRNAACGRPETRNSTRSVRKTAILAILASVGRIQHQQAGGVLSEPVM